MTSSKLQSINLRDLILNMHTQAPWLTQRDIAKLCRVSDQYVSFLIGANSVEAKAAPVGGRSGAGGREGMTAEEVAYADLIKTATAALFALRSYQYGNSSTELAEEIADALETALDKAAPVGRKA